MKKIFTLIATALFAVGAQAQTEKYAVEEGFTPTDGQEVQATASVKLVYGPKADWKAAAATGASDPKFSEADGFPVFVVGDANPKSDKDKNFTPGNAATLPAKGTYYSLTASQSGILEVAVKINGGKVFYIADAADGMNYSADAVLTNTDGETVALGGDFKVASTFYGFVKIGIQKDQTLMFFCSASKLGFFGFRFTPGEVTEDEGTPHAAQAWDFMSKLSDTDKTNIKADSKWEVEEKKNDNEETTAFDYKYTEKFEGVPATANGAELELTKGLKFRTGAGKFEYYDEQRLAFAGNGHGPIIPDCAKGDEVKIRFKAKDGAGFEVGNLELNSGTIMATEVGVFEAVFTVKKKGEVSFASVTGAELLALSVNADLPAAPIWTIAGAKPLLGSEWKQDDEANDMSTTDALKYTLVKENVTLEANVGYEYKVAKNHAWGESYGANGGSSNAVLKVDETGVYTVTFTFTADNRKALTAHVEKTGEAEVVEHTWSVVGDLTGGWEEDYFMEKGEDGIYTLNFNNVNAGTYEFKVRADQAWSINYPKDNVVVTVEVDGSTVTVTFNEETKEVKAEVTAPSAINSVKAGKTAAVRYNLAGQKVNASYQGVVIENGKKMIQK